MVATQQAAMFFAASGKSFVYLVDMPMSDGQVAYSPDGETFYALASKGFGGSRDEHDLSFDDPHHDVSGKLHRNGDVIEYDGETFTLQEAVFDPTVVVPLPNARRVEYLCRAENGTLIFVSSDVYYYSYESFRMFVGDGEEMREVPIQRVDRYRDGGTTNVFTDEGVFRSPSPFKAQQDSTLVLSWRKEPLANLNQDDFTIVEEGGVVTITEK